MDCKTLRFEVIDGIAHLTLNRPDAANALNLEMSQELYDAALRCDEDPEVRAVLISSRASVSRLRARSRSLSRMKSRLASPSTRSASRPRANRSAPIRMSTSRCPASSSSQPWTRSLAALGGAPARVVRREIAISRNE